MIRKRQFVINLVANILYMILNYSLTFYLGAYIVSSIGGEAYGFINLCNTTVNYATLITLALNSVASRFITIEVHKGNIEKANKYFSSTFIADTILAAVLFFVFVPITFKLDLIFDIPGNLILSVKGLFILTFLNLVISIIGTVYMVATFITNKLYLSSIANLIGAVVKVILLWLFFGVFPADLIFVGIATVAASIVILGMNVVYTHKLTGQLQIKFSALSFSCIKELIVSGIWNSVTKLSQILSDGLDLVISNIWVSAYAMGQLSIAYTIPTFISSIFSMVVSLFSPQLTENYAKGNFENVISEIKLNMKMTGFVGNIIFFGVVLIGKEFFQLWVPDANIQLVYELSVISIISILVSSLVTPLTNVFLLTNHLKVNSLVWLGISCFNTLCVFILLNTTSLGVYAVAGVSKFVGIVVYLTYLPIYASRCLQTKWTEFYPLIIRYIVVTFITGTLMTIVRVGLLGVCKSWIVFCEYAVILGTVGLISNYCFFLMKKERIYLKKVIIKKIIRK